MTILTIVETTQGDTGTPPLEVERLRMTVDGPVDVLPIIALLQKKPRAVRKDAGIPRERPIWPKATTPVPSNVPQ